MGTGRKVGGDFEMRILSRIYGVANWCREHPDKRAAIVMPHGTYVLVFTPKAPEPETLSHVIESTEEGL